MKPYRIRAFDKDIGATSFHCGQPLLDEYIRRYASQDIRRNVARVFMATPELDGRHLAGFFTLSTGSVSCSDLPAALAKKLSRYPVPVAFIGRLAVSTISREKTWAQFSWQMLAEKWRMPVQRWQ